MAPAPPEHDALKRLCLDVRFEGFPRPGAPPLPQPIPHPLSSSPRYPAAQIGLPSNGEGQHRHDRPSLRNWQPASDFDGPWEAGYWCHRNEEDGVLTFATVRYPDEAWELTPREKVPKVGDTLRRSGGKFVVSTVVEDESGHVIVTWQRAPAAPVT